MTSPELVKFTTRAPHKAAHVWVVTNELPSGRVDLRSMDSGRPLYSIDRARLQAATTPQETTP